MKRGRRRSRQDEDGEKIGDGQRKRQIWNRGGHRGEWGWRREESGKRECEKYLVLRVYDNIMLFI